MHAFFTFRNMIFGVLWVFFLVGCQQNKAPLQTEKPASASPVVPRIPGSPYPASQVPDTLFVIDEGHFTPAQRLTIETLQGILAQKKPVLYRLIPGGYTLWLSDLQEKYGVALDHSFETDFKGLLTHFKNRISGYILCSLNDASTNVALSLCGIRTAVTATPETQPELEALGIPLLQDVRGKTTDTLLQNFGDAFTPDLVFFQKPSKCLNLADYTIFSKGLTFFSNEKDPIFERVLGRSASGGALLGWGNDEFQLVSQSSRRNFWVHAADWSLNLSTLTNFAVDLTQKPPVDSLAYTRENVHTVCFLMTDGDNIQWLLNDFDTNPRWYASPSRGQVNLGWGMSPAMAELAPTVLNRFYAEASRSASGSDYFVAASSGLGYMYPERFPNLTAFAKLTAAFMEKADLHIVNIIGNSPSESALKPYLKQKQIDAIFYYAYSNYSAGNGGIWWLNDKPVICGRYNLWQGFETPTSLAEKLNRLPRDVRSVKGYSLIPVHVWSNGVSQVVECVRHLQPDVDVVTPDVFVKRIVHFLKPGRSR